jgi:hypothetical protein
VRSIFALPAYAQLPGGACFVSLRAYSTLYRMSGRAPNVLMRPGLPAGNITGLPYAPSMQPSGNLITTSGTYARG